MAELDISKTTTPSKLTDYSVGKISPEGTTDQDETYYDNPNFTKYFANYKKIAKIKKAIDGYATWILGKGWTADPEVTVTLENLTGWGEDTFNSIMWNAIVMKKVGGDTFTQIIRDPDSGELINLIPLNPEYMRIVTNKKGRVKRYEYRTSAGTDKSGAVVSFKPNEILHLCNNRVANEIHGVSDVEAVEWIMEFQEEAMRDLRKMLHRNGVIRVIEVDTDDPTKLAVVKAQWKDALDKGDVMIMSKGMAEAKDWHGTLDIGGVLAVIKYLDNLFYMSIGVPRVILGGSEEFTEASSKIGYLTFEQIYMKEQTDLEADLWNQLAIRIKFNKPASLKNEMLESEAKNTGQVGFQPNDMMTGIEEGQ